MAHGKNIGIGGISRGGKTKLAKELARLLRQKGFHVAVLHQDSYIVPESEIPTITHHNETRIDWEHPASIDWLAWQRAIETAQQSHDFVLAEGLFAFWKPEINEIYDFALFMSISETTFYQRKAEDKRWGEEPLWYVQHIWNAHQLYGQPPESLNALQLSGEKPLDKATLSDYIEMG